MSTKNLDKIFNPKSIAVIGASDTLGSVGYILVKNLLSSGYDGVVYPVNNKRKSVQGVKAYKTIEEVPEVVDLAVIAIPAKFVPAAAEACGKVGIKGLVIISAGFKELGKEGKELEDSIKEIVTKYDQRVLGPNCLGFIRPHLNLNASFAKKMAIPGKITFLSQSGAICTSILDWANSKGVGFSNFVSIGSTLNIDFGDLIDYFGSDAKTKSIILYVEAITDARTFMSAARGFSMTKPIIVVKSGVFSEGAKAAASHTGALAGEDAVYDAAFKRAGIVRVEELMDLFTTSEVLAKQPVPNGNRLAIITNAGGPGVMATDALIRYGGKLAELSKETIANLNKVLPDFWSKANPVDVLGDATADRYGKAMEVCLKDKGIDGVLVILTPQAMTDPTAIAKCLVEKSKGFNKPILASWMGADDVEEGMKLLNKGDIPTFLTPEQAIKSFIYLFNYGKNLKSLYETPENILEGVNPDKVKLRNMLKKIAKEGRYILNEIESKLLLEEYGIPVSKPILAKTAEEAVKIAKKMKYPVVLKLQSPDITHKSDAGGVRLNVRTDHGVIDNFEMIIDSAKKYKPSAKLEGVTVQPMVANEGYELILGSKKDNLFGSVILFGMGGIAVELFKDKRIGLPPLNDTLAKRLIEGTKIYEFLKGFRGKKAVNIDLLKQIVIRFSHLIVDFPEIKEMDINPFIIDHKEALALDARIAIDENMIFNDKAGRQDHLVIIPYPTEFIKKVNVKGKEIILRPIKPEDEPLHEEMFKTFSQDTVRFRFFRIIKELTREEVIRFCHSDYDREIALVAIIKDGGKEKMIGVCRLTGDPNNEKAEFAIMLRDDWQSKGLGEIMMDYILDIAKQKGWKTIYAGVLRSNVKMIKLFQKKGFKLEMIEGEGMYEVKKDIKG
ncbi:MAG: bifunctional acetate--CoA ligase family protein/GNAT family N-acetyltransferase [Nanoarchaeota archaeon]|nr:bifunctional acetate--CoA ligase family protein/GNAT family N-acetyltransferase [Nanoarchaeota archaeon]MBU1946655.1 bifunctional acetate--CoA ligase family protein/GNAT family N-acetyltransferase [Nanoarchaeota archaeon]